MEVDQKGPGLGILGAGIVPPGQREVLQAEVDALQQRLQALEKYNPLVGEGDHQAPLTVAQARLGIQLERRVAELEKDAGQTFKLKLPNPILDQLKEANRQFDAARAQVRGLQGLVRKAGCKALSRGRGANERGRQRVRG